ncbi:MAG: Xaa-Pro aminopeptidase [Proteobacteria bacterium]|nr:MAG: Xaa-Pro aminopeptidase [Pseudomonadota bacterium]PIE40517.1 MAG: Xaa-Pro aminopeptidase [Gammaproteobacteria bacterium]
MALPPEEHTKRRRALIEQMSENCIAILPAAPEKNRNRDVHYPFRQDSDFFYLTGFSEPDAVLVLVPGREHGESILFCREKNPEKELWDGVIVGPEGVVSELGLDDAFPISDIDEILPGLIEGKNKLYYSMGLDTRFDKRVMDWINAIRSKVRSGAHPPGEFVALEYLLHDMRLYKSPAELKIMEKACKIAAEAHVRAMQKCQPGMFEYQLESEIMHGFLESGCRSTAYPSIVGAGKNGCILHYIDNDSKIADGELVLIDAGCELDYYAADITRTFPANGRFTDEQKAVYEIVLRAQKAAIEKVVVGNHWNHPHETAVRVITEGLVELGLLQGSVDDLIEKEAFTKYYMHRTGHWLGMDVHDVGDYKVGGQWRELEPNMVLTIEPGIYISPDEQSVEPGWRGIGIRIEDDVVVTRKGPKVLTGFVPKEVAEIEAIMANTRVNDE